MAYRKSKKTANRQGMMGAKLSFTGKTKSGKGVVKLYAKKGFAAMKQTLTPYRTATGQRRILVTQTIKKVIK